MHAGRNGSKQKLPQRFGLAEKIFFQKFIATFIQQHILIVTVIDFLMKSKERADCNSKNVAVQYPRTTYNGSADMTAVVSTIQDGMVQWLVAADRDTNNYDPNGAIPIGEMQYDRRMVNVWASSDSRIITLRSKLQYKLSLCVHLP